MKYTFLVLGLSLTPPLQAAEPPPWGAWVPSKTRLVISATGDLDGDGLHDAVLVVAEDDPRRIVPNPTGLGPERLNLNPRRLVILLRSATGYRQVLDAAGLLPPEHSEGTPCLADPLDRGGLSIDEGALRIRMEHWLSCGSSDATNTRFIIRHAQGRFRLIGIDRSEQSRMSGARSECSINYLTGRMKLTEGLNHIARSRPVVKWQPLAGPTAFYLDDLPGDLNAMSNTCIGLGPSADED